MVIYHRFWGHSGERSRRRRRRPAEPSPVRFQIFSSQSIRMARRKAKGLLITGTDTGVGKTYVAASIARTLSEAGCRVGVYKPAASGCRQDHGELVSHDALALRDDACRPGELSAVCPQRFAAPLAPHLAAEAEGHSIDEGLLRSGLDYWHARSDVVLVEGAGGLLSPLSASQYVADLAHDLELPLVVVTRNRIGAINQALQTLAVAATFRRGLAIAAVVLCHTDADDGDPSCGSQTVMSWLGACHGAGLHPARLSRHAVSAAGRLAESLPIGAGMAIGMRRVPAWQPSPATAYSKRDDTA